jgi:hypothetical protein
MADTPDFLERADNISKNWTGEGIDHGQVVERFHLYSLEKRAEALDAFDSELRTADTSNLRRYSKLVALRRDMDHVHHNLRKVGR